MNIDLHWLCDDEIAAVGRREPSTALGRELFRRWGDRCRGPVSSDTYRGCAIALTAVYTECSRNGATMQAIRQIVEDFRRSVPVSRHFPIGTLRQRGVLLALTNARHTAQCSASAADAIAVYESKMIYAARGFAVAREEELAAFALV